MVKWKCLNCKETVVTFHHYGPPRSCKACNSPSVFFVQIDQTENIAGQPLTAPKRDNTERPLVFHWSERHTLGVEQTLDAQE